MTTEKIAVIGAGISGMAAAWLLSRSHQVCLIEQDDRLGGHANTVDTTDATGRTVPIDTGFIVYNTACYPNLIALFEHLLVPTNPTSMSFAVSLDSPRGLGNGESDRGAYEYAGNARGLFDQPRNLIDRAHWQMVRDIRRFFTEAPHLADPSAGGEQSLADWLRDRKYSPAFIARHIRPMAAAIWSTPSVNVLDFPAAAFARFFANHGLLQVRNRPEWRTVAGGSRAYVTRLTEALIRARLRGHANVEIRKHQAIDRITRRPDGIELHGSGGDGEVFDRVIVATHADQALAMLAAPTPAERQLLGAFRYTRNETYLHTDARLMPKRRRLWSSWNYIGQDQSADVCVSYHMNTLQRLPTKTDYFVTLNPIRDIDPAKRVGHWSYQHPLFDRAAMQAQRELGAIQGQGGLYFAGAYMGFGFHECGAQAGLAAAELAGGQAVRRPWSHPQQNDRLAYMATSARNARATTALAEAAE